MTTLRNLSIRTVLLVDAAITGATALLMLLGAPLLDDALDLPAALLAGAGVMLMPYVAFLIWLVTRPAVPDWALGPLIAAGIGWAVGCMALLFSGQVDPNGLGTAFVLIQVVAVLVFADLQYLAMRGEHPERARNAVSLEV